MVTVIICSRCGRKFDVTNIKGKCPNCGFPKTGIGVIRDGKLISVPDTRKYPGVYVDGE